jgi:hypothetical protein
VRNDGSLLVRYPASAAPPVLARDTPFMKAIAANPDRGTVWRSGRDRRG